MQGVRTSQPVSCNKEIVFDADAGLSVQINTWLIGQDHACLNGSSDCQSKESHGYPDRYRGQLCG